MHASGPQKLGLSLDPQTLNALKTQAGNMPQAALQKVAKQFEGMFLNMMLKSMRETVGSDGPFDNEQTRMFNGMLDEQYASQMTEGHGMGLADMIVRQLGPAAKAAGTAGKGKVSALSGPAAVGLAASDPGTDQQVVPADAIAADMTPGGGQEVQAAEALAAANGSAAVPRAALHRGARTPAAFKASMAAHAQAASEVSGIPADFMIAQAGLESGWGQHQPLTSDGQPSHNLFGIKAGASWKGAVANAETTEVVNGVAQRTVQPFRAYASYAEAFQDYAGLLSGSARYARALAAGTAAGFAHGLQQAGYASDPDYAAKLQRAIRLTGDVRA